MIRIAIIDDKPQIIGNLKEAFELLMKFRSFLGLKMAKMRYKK
jgi:hypothetical protein